jgi:hypothetical protein
MTESIVQLVDQLPQDNITVKVLNALDFVVPGEWSNTVGFDQTIRVVTGESNPQKVQRIKERALSFYEDDNKGYKSAVSLYQIIDKADTAMAAAALASKIGEKIEFLSFLNRITPKADVTQSVDLALKIVVEIIAFCKLNGLPQPNPQAFVESLSQNYTDASLMRMAALVCLDGLLPLGPDFLAKIHDFFDQNDGSAVKDNPVFNAISHALPGDNLGAKFGFITQSFGAVQGWMSGLISKTGVTPSSIFQGIGSFIQVADDSLDFVAAFLDQTTNYYEHTGIQTVARRLILDAYESVKPELQAAEGGSRGGSRGGSPSEAGDFAVGQEVDVFSDDYWYAGRIREVRGDQYLIRYLSTNDPDEDEWVSQENLGPAGGHFNVGDEVEVLYRDGEWYEAEILKSKGDTYLVKYTDEDFYDDEDEDEEKEWVAWQRLCCEG